METLIDKVKVAGATNIPTVGFKTLLVLLANGATGAADYDGTAAEAAALKAGITVTVADNAAATGAAEIAAEYIKVRTQADTKNAFLEIALGAEYVSAITLPAGIAAVARLLTQPSHSEV